MARCFCSRSEDYYIQHACGPDPYIDRLVATVLALPRPQLSPADNSSSTEKTPATSQAAPPDVQKMAEQTLARVSVDEKAVLTQPFIRDDEGVQATAQSNGDPVADPDLMNPHSPQTRDTAAQESSTKARGLHSLASRDRRNSTPSVRRPALPSPRRLADQSCRDQHPQSVDPVELRVVADSAAGSRSTICSSMTGVVEGMPVGRNAAAMTAGRGGVLHAVQRTHSTPPRRKTGCRKAFAPKSTPPHTHYPEQTEDRTADTASGFAEDPKTGSDTSRLDRNDGTDGEGNSGDASGCAVSVSFASSSDGESALISPPRRSLIAETTNNSDGLEHSASCDAAKQALAALDSFSPVASNASTCSRPGDAVSISEQQQAQEHRTLPMATTHKELSAERQANLAPEPEPESEAIRHRCDHSQVSGNPPQVLWSNVPFGKPMENVLQTSPDAPDAGSLLSPTSLQQLSGRSEAISVPSEPGEDTSCYPQASSPLPYTGLQELAVSVAGSWRAVMKEITPKGRAHMTNIETMMDPPAGTDLEVLYAQHKRAESLAEAAEATSTLCFFELQQLGPDFVTGHHVRIFTDSHGVHVHHFCFDWIWSMC